MAALERCLKPLCAHPEPVGEGRVSGLPFSRASPFGRQSWGPFLTYSSRIGQAFTILGAASLPQSGGGAGCSALCCEERRFGGRMPRVLVSRSTAPADGEPGLPLDL